MTAPVAGGGGPLPGSGKRMRLRYAGTCRSCGAALEARDTAVYEPDSKTVVCLVCSGESGAGIAEHPEGTSPATELPSVVPGSAGASAQREYERRKANREERVRAAHPKIG